MTRRSAAVRSQILGDFSEKELNKLRLQCHRADATNRTHAAKTQRLISRDRREIQRLQNEREELLRNLGATSTDTSVFQDFTAMLASEDGIDEQIKDEKGKLTVLKEQVLRSERQLAAQRMIGGAMCCKSENSGLLKKTYQVENQLCRGQKRFSELMMKNGQLREELTTLQLERKQFLHIHSQMKKEVHAHRRDIINLMTKCTEAFNASAKMQKKQRLSADQDIKDVAQYVKERSYLELEKAHYLNFGAFLHTKASARINQDTDYRKDDKQLEFVEWELEDFEHAMKKLLKETKESDLDKLVKNFIQMDDQTYTLVNFVNNQHNEAEGIRREISELSNEMKALVIGKQKQQEQNQDLELNISFKQEASEQQLTFYQQRVELLGELLDQLRAGVESLLQVTCDSSVICDQLGFSEGVQGQNIAEYLKIVENRVNALFTLQSYLRFQEDQRQWDIDSLSTTAEHLLGIKPPSLNLTTTAAIPAPAHVNSDPESLDLMLQEAKYPLSREDLLTRFNERIQKKQNRLI